MPVLTVTINTPATAFVSKASETAFLENALLITANELKRNQGNVTSGGIVGPTPNGSSTTSLGSWSYVPTATLP
jgi:hypothetical protein